MLRIIVTAIAFMFMTSCNDNQDQKLAVNKLAAKGLFQSSEALASHNNTIYKALEQRLSEPASSERAKIWQPKALLIKSKSDSLFNYFEFLIVELKKKAGLKVENFIEVFDENNSNAVETIITDNNTDQTISSKLNQYKKDVLGIDPELNEQFARNTAQVSTSIEQSYFKGINVMEAIVILRKMQNEVRNIEDEMILFCLNKIPTYKGCGYDLFNAIVSQSSSIVKRGEKVTVQAGIGAFSIAASPIVTIDGRVFKPDYDKGFVEYSFSTPVKPGAYSTPITIEYTKEDGTKQKKSYNIEYTVKE